MLSNSYYLTFWIFFGLSVQSQNDSLVLPLGSHELKINVPIQIFDVYVTKDRKVYCEGKRLKYFDEISSLLVQNQRERPDSFPRMDIYLHADKRLPYSFVDRIKSEIGRSWHFIVYKTDALDGLYGITRRVIGTHLSSRYSDTERIIDTKTQAELDSIWRSLRNEMPPSASFPLTTFPPTPPPPPAEFDEYKLARLLYQNNTEGVKDILNRRTHSVLTFFTKNKYTIDNNEYDLSEKEKLIANLTKSDIILMRFADDLTYGDYIKVISKIAEFQKDKLKNFGFIIEISKECEAILKLSDPSIFEG